MGEVLVEITVANPVSRARSARVRALADTGATLSVIPGPVLESLGIEREDSAIGILADGREVTRDVGHAVVTVNSRSASSLVIFGEPEDLAILGLTVLEQLGLAVEPERGRLVPGRLLF